MAEKESKQNQDGALAWLVVTTLAPHWRALLVAVLLLLATAALNDLIAGPTPAEQANGYFSELGPSLGGPSN